MSKTTNGYDLLAQHPAPPPETVPLLRRVWDAHRTEDWLLNAAWPEGCGAPGEHLTASGTDGAGRWAVHDGERLRARDCEWLRHITEVQAVRRTWWRTHWQSWPARAGQTREPRELRIALDCDPESPVQMFQLYVALGDDEKPIGTPELRTFKPGRQHGDADRGSRRHRDQPGCGGPARVDRMASVRRPPQRAALTSTASASTGILVSRTPNPGRRQPPNGRRAPVEWKKCGRIQAGPYGDGFRATIEAPS